MIQVQVQTIRSLSNKDLTAIAVAVVEAKKRITVATDKTFYSEHDQWFFRAEDDDRVCFACTELDGVFFKGSVLRTGFPYHDPLDEDIILAKVHPNCRCRLIRLTKTTSLTVITDWED